MNIHPRCNFFYQLKNPDHDVVEITTTTMKHLLSAKSLRPHVKKAALGPSTWYHAEKPYISKKIQQNMVKNHIIKNYVCEDMNKQDEKDHYDTSSHKKKTHFTESLLHS